jgi:hypothetical protein
MTTIAEIKNTVRSLPDDQLEEFASWFEEFWYKIDDQIWDDKIARDQESGPLRDLMERAAADYKAGKCRVI